MKRAADAFEARCKASLDKEQERLDKKFGREGFNAFKEQPEAVGERHTELEEALIDTPAQTLEGVAIKFRAIQSSYSDEMWVDNLTNSALADLKRLSVAI